LNSSILNIKMEHLLSSKLIAYWGFATFALAGIDENLLNSLIFDSLNINPILTNFYMIIFTVYYLIKMFWFWQDKSLDKKERLKRLNL